MDSAILSEMIETRRRLHQHPEEGWTEFETTWLVYNRLKALGCESVLTGTRLINPDCVLGRSEALVEKAVNRAIAAGVPAEEGVRGANAIVGSGFVDDVDVILASHGGGAIKSKQIGLVYDGLLASTKFDIRFTGVPSHAGNQPHAGKSALLAACSTCLQMAGIPRHGDGATRVSLGKLNAGEGRNITPAHAYIQAEVRGQTPEINDFLCRNVEHIVKGNAEAYQVQYELERVGEATTIVSCPDILEVIGDVARQTEGVADVVELRKPSGSEDYSLMLKRVVERGGRGAMFRWGCRHHGHHKSDFDIQDKETMPVAFGIFTGCVLRFNGIDSGATD